MYQINQFRNYIAQWLDWRIGPMGDWREKQPGGSLETAFFGLSKFVDRFPAIVDGFLSGANSGDRRRIGTDQLLGSAVDLFYSTATRRYVGDNFLLTINTRKENGPRLRAILWANFINDWLIGMSHSNQSTPTKSARNCPSCAQVRLGQSI